MSSVTDKRFLKLLRLLQQPKATPAPRKQARAKRAATADFQDGFEPQAKQGAAKPAPKTDAPPFDAQRFPDVIEYRSDGPAGDTAALGQPPAKPSGKTE